MSGGIPFDAIRTAALANATSLLMDWFPQGRVVGHEFKVGSIRGEPGESLSINLHTGVWADFASHEKGADLIDLRAAMVHAGDVGAAAFELGGMLGISVNGADRYPGKPAPRPAKAKASDDWQPMVPPPDGAQRPPELAFSGFDSVHEYTDTNDRVTHYVGRIEARNGRKKLFIPLTYGTLDGVHGWHKRRPANPLPLYGLNRLATFPDADPILCEGEKSADAAQAMFHNHPCLSSYGGTGSVDYADLTPLAGRQVIIWPDADDAGRKAAAKIASRLKGSRIVNVHGLPEGFDAADLVDDDPEAWLRARLERGPEPQPRGTAYGRLLVLNVDDVDTAAPRDYLLKGLMSPNEISLWVGAAKCGKSFLLLYVAYMLSLGRPVFKRRVKPTKVLYVAAEGEGGIDKRIRALRDRYGRSENFHFIAQPIDLLRNGGHKLEVIDAATAIGAQLIVIDTLNRAIAGGDENSSQDMGGSVSDIKCATKAHVGVIHHGTKASNGSRPRGHSSLEGADDALIDIVKQSDGSRVATVVHAKDDADGMQWAFDLDMVELGIDDDGDRITTLIVREMPEAPAMPDKAAPLSNNEQIALACFDKAMKAEGIFATVGEDHEERKVVQELVFRRWFYAEAKPGESQNTKRQAFNRAVEGLQAKGRLECRDGMLWRPDTW